MPPVRDWGYLSSEARGSIPLSDDGDGGRPDRERRTCSSSSRRTSSRSAPTSATPGASAASTASRSGQQLLRLHHHAGRALPLRHQRRDRGHRSPTTRTPLICFRRKGRGMTSLTGEKLSENQVIDAMASRREGARPHRRALPRRARCRQHALRVQGGAREAVPGRADGGAARAASTKRSARATSSTRPSARAAGCTRRSSR